MPMSQRSFEMYRKGSDSSFEEVPLSDEERKTTFFYLKGSKSSCLDHKQNFNSVLLKMHFGFIHQKWHLSRENEDCVSNTGFKSGDTSLVAN